MNVREALASSLKQYGNWRGRASRSEFWWFAVSSAALLVGLLALGNALGSNLAPLLGVAVLLPPTTTLGIRRLHDTGHTGGW